MNINSKERENTTNSTSTRRRTRSQKTSGSLCSKLEVFIWRHVVYMPKLSTTFRGILICVIFRPRDMQEYYMLFGIFAKDVGLYFLSVFYIAWANFQYTNVYLFCVLHTYHCVPFTGECHGTAAYKAHTTSIYDVISHRLILFLPQVWTAFEGRHIRITNKWPQKNYITHFIDILVIRAFKGINLYVPLVVNTFRSFPHSWHHSLPFRSICVHTRFSVKFRLLNL